MGSLFRIVCFCVVCLFGGVVQGQGPAEQEKPFYLTIDTPPAPELSPAQALASFSLAPGFKVELVAAEPLVEDPVAITWDEAGRLYAVEMRGYMPDAYGNDEDAPVGVVVRVTDRDRDGTYDHREVLLDKLVLPRALAIVNEGLLVGEPPNLWLCPNENGSAATIDCAQKRNLGTYGDQPGSVEHAENGLLVGLDNWLYSAKSNRRLRIREGQLEVEPTLFRGQWGITQDNTGRLFYNTNSNLLLGDYFDARYVIAAGNTGAPGLGEQVSVNDQLFAVRVNPGVNRAYVPGVLREDGRLNRPTSASGMAVYRGDQFGAEHVRDVFVAEPAANAVVRLQLVQNGLQISADHMLYPDETWGEIEFFASTDERFRPVDVKVGPDGALYVVDMYRGIIQDHVFLTDQLRAQALARNLDKPVGMGRIWRIRAESGGALRTRTDLVNADAAALVQMLGHPNAWQRETAQRLLLARRDSGLKQQLENSVRQGQPLQAVHALWTLSGRGELNRKATLAGLARQNEAVKLAAIQAGGSALKRRDLLKLVKNTSEPVLAQHLVLGLVSHNRHPAVRATLIQILLGQARDPYRPAAVKAAAFGQELALLDELVADKRWNEDFEQQTKFVQNLVVQGFRADPAMAGPLLDRVQASRVEQRWLQIAVLDGIYEVSRAEGFERVELTSEHDLFAAAAMADEALWPAISRARRALTWPGDDLAADAKPLSPQLAENRALGAEYYRSRCATCHGEDGQGIASLAPPLAGSEWVTGSSERLARIILHGLQGPIEVAGTTWNGVMPGHANVEGFSDAVGSGLMTYLQRAWGHTGRAIDPAFFAAIRKQSAQRTALWTVPELMQLPVNTHYRRYEGRYGRPGFALAFVYNGQDLEVQSPIFNGPMIEEKEDQFLFEPRQLRLEFVIADDGSVSGVRMLSPDGETLLPRMAD